jgi:sugar lactone lactonase YvrE
MVRVGPALAVATFVAALASAQEPVPGPDSLPQDGVPKGEVIKGTFENSRIYPGTWREYWVYVPPGLDRAKQAPVMVFQDGLQYDAPVVFDNLIHKGEIPRVVGVFVMHGRVKASSEAALDRMNRSYEYDSITGEYPRFLLDELLPHVAATHGLTLSADGNDRAIAGNSSGAICAWNAAWQRPDAFRRVFSAIGTYVGIRGGDSIPTSVRKSEPKPIRVFLQDGKNDLDNPHGSWWVANQDMLSALLYAGYDVRHEWGDGEHNSRHAKVLFPDVMRFLWRDWPRPVEANPEKKSKQPFLDLLVPGEGWRLVSEGHGLTEGPAVNAKGEFFFVDMEKSRIHKVGLDGQVAVFAENTGRASGLMFGPDGRLYVCANERKEVAVYDDAGKATVLARDAPCNDLAVTRAGDIYFTDPGGKRVRLLPKGGVPRVVDEGIGSPNGVRLSADQSLLFVTDYAGTRAYSFQVQADGSLAHREPFFHLHVPDASIRPNGDGMTVDTEGNIYLACRSLARPGVMVIDPGGKELAFVETGPRNQQGLFDDWKGIPSNVEFGIGDDGHSLYVTIDKGLHRIRVKTRGFHPHLPAR